MSNSSLLDFSNRKVAVDLPLAADLLPSGFTGSSLSIVYYPDLDAMALGVAPGSGGGVALKPTPVWSILKDGAQALKLSEKAGGVLDLNVHETQNGLTSTRPLYQQFITLVSGSTLNISADAGLRAGDEIRGQYYLSGNTGGGGSAGPAVTIEQNLLSNSPDTVPSVQAVNNALTSPLTADMEIWMEADNPQGFGKNKTGKADSESAAWGQQYIYKQNAVNSLPSVLWDYPTGPLYFWNRGAGNGTLTILIRMDNPPGSGGIIMAHQYFALYNSQVGPGGYMKGGNGNETGKIDADPGTYNVFTMHCNGLRMDIYKNGKANGFIINMVNNDLYRPAGLFFAQYMGGHFELFNSWQGEVVAVLASRDESRAAGRLHEQYLNNKYKIF